MEINDALPTEEEMQQTKALLRELHDVMESTLGKEDFRRLHTQLRLILERMPHARSAHGLSLPLLVMRTATAFASMVDADRNILLAILLYQFVQQEAMKRQEVASQWGEEVASLIDGIAKVERYSRINTAVNADNYRGLLLSLAEDIRVIIIMIVRNLVIMRMINLHPDEEWVRSVAFESSCLYAQLAHRLGLYKIKGELEDLALKYTNRDIYKQIARKLNETKRERDAYITAFIGPVKERLEKAGLKFEIKGRTKSISSIWAKIKKQKVDMQHIYDLFAIRVIIDTPREKEKSDCWLAYSILADMYTANPARMKDWISIPKSNGYESLHATVMGPGSKWVEVQFRTRRMDLVAEKGLAAHWRYKGGKGDSTDQWMNNIRDILETAEAGPMELMKNMRVDAYGKEVFAFTPKGDLFRLSANSSVLDFAFLIHSRVGCTCTGAVVNGRHEKINYKIKSGDTVEIITSSTQTPKHDWLNMVVTSKARNKIRQMLNEEKIHKATLGKEMLERRAKNRKLEIDEATLMKLVKKNGYKYANDFFADVADNAVDLGKFLAACQAAIEHQEGEAVKVSAGEYRLADNEEQTQHRDVLIIGGTDIKGLNYKYAKCCSPVYGDNVFGFISSDGTVKIHKTDCPNARNIRERYPYRIISTRWSGTSGGWMAATIHIIGSDDIGIVTNITSVIAKEPDVSLRNIQIDSHDGIFEGYLVLSVADARKINPLIKKLSTIKGVKNATRV